MGHKHSCLRYVRYKKLTTLEDDTGRKTGNKQKEQSRGSMINLLPTEEPTLMKESVSQQDLLLIAKNVGNGYETIGLELGLSLVVIEGCQGKYPHSPYMQIISMLTKWKERNGQSATRRDLFEALMRCNPVCTIDWDGLFPDIDGTFLG